MSAVSTALIQHHRDVIVTNDLINITVDVPAITGSLFLFMAAIHWLVHYGPWERELWIIACSLHTKSVIQARQWHRLWTHAFLHGNLAHFASNMISFVKLGSSLEKRLGKTKYAATLIVGTLLSPVIDIGLKLFATWLIRIRHDNVLSLGFSAVIFHLFVVDYSTARETYASIKEIATKFAPMLVSSQAPGVSFVGHLSGVISGTLQVVVINLWRKQRMRRGKVSC